MKKLVVYDSQYGNTEKIAQAVAKSIGAHILLASKVKSSDLENLHTLVVGSPTQGGRNTASIQSFLNSLPDASLTQVRVTAFDTRFLEQELSWPLKILVKTIGYAAPKIAKELQSKGGSLIIQPEGFIVTRTEGPLAEGELQRAQTWLVEKVG